MGVINTIDDTLTHPRSAFETTGGRVMMVQSVISIAAADSDGSQWLLGELPDQAILESISIECPAITGGTDFDFGIADTAGNVILGHVFAQTVDMSSVSGLPTGPTGDAVRQVMTGVAATDVTKKLFEYAGHVNKAFPASGETNRKSKYRIIMTANTVGSLAVDLVARIRYLMAV